MSKEYPYGHPFWLDKPERNEVVNWQAFLMEDLFQNGHIFKNGIKGTPCHSDSYMTCVDYENLDKTFDIIQKEYNLTKEEWMGFLTGWIHRCYGKETPMSSASRDELSFLSLCFP